MKKKGKITEELDLLFRSILQNFTSENGTFSVHFKEKQEYFSL